MMPAILNIHDVERSADAQSKARRILSTSFKPVLQRVQTNFKETHSKKIRRICLANSNMSVASKPGHSSASALSFRVMVSVLCIEPINKATRQAFLRFDGPAGSFGVCACERTASSPSIWTSVDSSKEENFEFLLPVAEFLDPSSGRVGKVPLSIALRTSTTYGPEAVFSTLGILNFDISSTVQMGQPPHLEFMPLVMEDPAETGVFVEVKTSIAIFDPQRNAVQLQRAKRIAGTEESKTQTETAVMSFLESGVKKLAEAQVEIEDEKGRQVLSRVSTSLEVLQSDSSARQILVNSASALSMHTHMLLASEHGREVTSAVEEVAHVLSQSDVGSSAGKLFVEVESRIKSTGLAEQFRELSKVLSSTPAGARLAADIDEAMNKMSAGQLLEERDRQQLMQRLSCHMREVLALPVVVDDGSKRGTQLISELLDDSSLNVLVDQMESVFASLDMKSDSSARKLIQAARTMASEMSTKTGERVLIEAKALIKDIGTKGVASIMQDPGDVIRSIVQDRPLNFLKDHHARIDAMQRSIVRYVVELLPRLSLPVYTGIVPSSPIGDLSLVLNNVRFSELQILEDNVSFRSRLLSDRDDPIQLRPAQSVLHFRCHDVNVNIDGALWAYRGNTWPHVTSDGTAFINVTGATITLEFDVRVNSKGTFEFFLLHNQVNLGQLGLKLVSGYGSTASWFFGIFVAVMRTNVQKTLEGLLSEAIQENVGSLLQIFNDMNLSSVFDNVLPLVETGFSSAHSPVESPAVASPSEVILATPAAIAASSSAVQAPLARSLDDSPMISSLQQSGSAVAEGDTWML